MMRKQGAINLAGALIKIAAASVAMPLTVRFCGLEEFGRWSFFLSVGTVLATCDFGIPTTVAVLVAPAFVGQANRQMSARVSYIATSSLFVALVMGIVASAVVFGGPYVPQTAKFFSAESANVALAVSMGLFVASRILGNAAAAFLQAAVDYSNFVLLGLIFVLPTAVGVPVAAFLGFRTAAFLHLHTVFSIGSLLAHLVIVERMRRSRSWRFSADRQEWRAMARFGLGSWLGAAGGIMFSQLDRVVVGLLLSTRQLGIYAASTQITSQINTLSAIPVQPLLPLISRMTRVDQAAAGDVRTLVSDAGRVNTALAFVLSGAVAIAAPAIADVLSTPRDAAELTLTLRILAAIYGAYSLNAVGFYSLFATHELRRLWTITIGTGILTLGTIALGASLSGLPGAAIGNVSFIATLSLTWVAIRRFRMSIARWARMIWLPFACWSVLLAIGFVVDVRESIAAGSFAIALLLVIATWGLLPATPGRALIATIKGAWPLE